MVLFSAFQACLGPGGTGQLLSLLFIYFLIHLADTRKVSAMTGAMDRETNDAMGALYMVGGQIDT